MCLFCEVDREPGNLVFVNDLIVVMHKEPPAPVAGWLMIAPRQHIVDQKEIDRSLWNEITAMQFRLTQILLDATGTHRIYQAAFAEATPHLHYHLIPAPSDLSPIPRGAAIFSEVTHAKGDEIRSVLDEIRDRLAQPE